MTSDMTSTIEQCISHPTWSLPSLRRPRHPKNQPKLKVIDFPRRVSSHRESVKLRTFLRQSGRKKKEKKENKKYFRYPLLFPQFYPSSSRVGCNVAQTLIRSFVRSTVVNSNPSPRHPFPHSLHRVTFSKIFWPFPFAKIINTNVSQIPDCSFFFYYIIKTSSIRKFFVSRSLKIELLNT